MSRVLLVVVASATLVGVVGCPDENGGEEENTAALCSDGRDNDGDQRIDCDDIGCAPFCGVDGDSDIDADHDEDVDEDVDADEEGDSGGDGDSDVDEDPDPDPEVDEDGPIGCVEDDDCPVSMRCYDRLLEGALACAPGGHSCSDDDDCSPGVLCDVVARWGGIGTYCLVTDPGCVADSDCPDGFRCEAGDCEDRRFLCSGDGDCPWWDGCFALRSGLRICAAAGMTACTIDDECSSELCVDVDGDGDSECQEAYGSTCETNADCTGMVCGDEDGERGVECGSVGPCLTTDDCPGTMECADVNGDGDSECQVSGGACLVDADCPERELCFDSDGTGGAECVAP